MPDSHNPSGCLCRECYGLREWAIDHLGQDYGLPPAPGHEQATLHVLTADPLQPAPRCDNSLTCTCPPCEQQRVAVLKVKPPVRQPWETRPARKAA